MRAYWVDRPLEVLVKCTLTLSIEVKRLMVAGGKILKQDLYVKSREICI